MQRVLITGMSGTGKSAVIAALAARGFAAYDLDTPEWSAWVDADPADTLTPANGKDWVWQEERVRALLTRREGDILFVSGCAQNMDRLLPSIDTVVLLRAPLATVMHRLEARTSDGYGHTAEERRKVRELIETVEPQLQEIAHHQVDTQQTVDETVERILRAVAARPRAS